MIDPFDPSYLKSGSYVFTLASIAWTLDHDQTIDVRSSQVQYDQVTIEDDGYVIEPGRFLLCATGERLTLSDRVSCIMDVRPVLAHVGLSVLLGSTFIEPGHQDSIWGVPLVNLSPCPIRIYAGMNLVKLVFHEMKTPSQNSYSGSGIFNNKRDVRVNFKNVEKLKLAQLDYKNNIKE